MFVCLFVFLKGDEHNDHEPKLLTRPCHPENMSPKFLLDMAMDDAEMSSGINFDCVAT